MSQVTVFKQENYFVGTGVPQQSMFTPAGAFYIDRESGFAYTFANNMWTRVGNGGGSLPLQVAADGDPVLLNAASDVVLLVDASGNPVVQSSSGAAYIFDASGGVAIIDAFGHEFDLNHYVYTNVPVNIDSAGIAASLTTDLGVPNADLTFTYNSVGAGGNAITVEYVDPGMPDQSFSKTFVDGHLVENLATDGMGAITTTASYIQDNGVPADITITFAPGSDGSGIVTALSPTNLSGGLAALNVTGPSSLDNGAITTTGFGQVVANQGFQAGSAADNAMIIGPASPGEAPIMTVYGTDTDISLRLQAQGAGTINLNSPVLASALPTSDPAVAGALWVDPAGGLYIVKVSQG